MVSTVLRNIIRQLDTPDHLRGRMTGVNMVFFMGGPQLGELEAGVVAQWLGRALLCRHRRSSAASSRRHGSQRARRRCESIAAASLTAENKPDYDP